MSTILRNKWLILALRFILGVILVTASIAKLRDITGFINTVASYEILNYQISTIYAFAVSLGELIIGCALLLGVFAKLAAVLCIPLVISFAVASSYAIANRVEGPCGCFGTFLKLSHPLALTIDLLMLAAVVIILLNKTKGFLTVGHLAERLKINLKMVKWTGMAFLSGILLFYAIFVPVRLSQYFNSPTYGVLSAAPEILTIPDPLATDVDAALASNKPILMEFYVDSCHLCQLAAPTIFAMADEFAGKITLMRLNYYDYYQNAQLIAGMHVTNIPSVLVITGKNSDGKYIATAHLEGIIPRDALHGALQRAIQSNK